MWGAGVLVATAGPLGLLVPDLYPPWPEHSYVIGVIFAAVAAIVSFSVGLGYARPSGTARNLRSGVALTSIVLGSASLIWYFAAYSTRVVVETQMVGAEQHQLRFVVGTEMRPDVDKTPDANDLELLRDNQYTPDRIWTSKSLQQSRFLLLLTFVSSFSLLTFGMGLLATRSATSSRSASSRNVKLRPSQH